MKKTVIVFIFIIMILGIVTGCTNDSGDKLQYDGTVKYTMYIGLNDKDTYTQLISYEGAEKITVHTYHSEI